MKRCMALVLLVCGALPAFAAEDPVPAGKKVYILPIREDIMPPLVYLVRRGVKEAMDAKADLLVLDMETNGGRVDVTEEIMEVLAQFPAQTVTYVNRRAFSAGAFIAVATQKIFMAPQSIIGAAAPILMMPGGGTDKMPETMEAKITSGLKAIVRTNARKNGYNVDVVEAMIDRTKEVTIDGKVLNEKGQILTLTNEEAEETYGDPPKPLLSSGTVKDLDELLRRLDYASATRVAVEPTGAEKLATWINSISPLLLIIGMACIYLEFKTPGFGIPGIIAVVAFALYFLGSYIAGLAGLEWAVVFLLGLALLVLELFVFPGTIFIGLAGFALMLLAIFMGMVDLYPGLPSLPSAADLTAPLGNLVIAIAGSVFVIWALSKLLPRTPLYSSLVSTTASGVLGDTQLHQTRTIQIGQVGIAISVLRPGGKAQFGDQILDVITQGEMIGKGARVRIIGHSGREAIVETIEG